MAKPKYSPAVQIIVRADGVDRVRLVGRSWDDEAGAQEIYQKIARLVREIDRTMKDEALMPQ